MSTKTKLIAGLVASLGVVLGTWLATMPASAQDPADESLCSTATYTTVPPPCPPFRVINLNNGRSVGSFDISFVDSNSHTYALASRVLSSASPTPTGPKSNPGIVVVDTTTLTVVTALGSGTSNKAGLNFTPFAGNCPNVTLPGPPPVVRSGLSGPNGVIIVPKPGGILEFWAGDAPIFTKSCDPTSGFSRHSAVVVFGVNPSQRWKTVYTKNPIVTGGVSRADELCYNPKSNVVLVANDNALDSFITFINASTYAVIGKIRFDGTDPNGNYIQASGIEQCQFNPRDGLFYLNIPASSSGFGYVLRISATAPFHVEGAVAIDPSTGCAGPAGLAVGPANQLALGCGGTNSLIISDTFPNGSTSSPSIIKTVAGQGGADEIWYDFGTNHYYFARSGASALGVEDAGNATTSPAPDTTVDLNGNTCTGCIPTATGSHSVAADSLLKLVFVPIRAATSTMPNIVCSGGKDAFNFIGADSVGCIAVYQATTDGDDVSGGSTGSTGGSGGGGGGGGGGRR
jgi:hypothetical protein